MKIEKTFTASIHVGLKIRETGEIQSVDEAKEICQNYCNEVGLCVSFTPTKYIYTNGEEPGVIVGLINYPRFPLPKQKNLSRALTLASLLMHSLSQMKVCVVCKDKTYMLENENIKILEKTKKTDWSWLP
jgi:Fe-S-cluster-containing hydrogenase component 2